MPIVIAAVLPWHRLRTLTNAKPGPTLSYNITYDNVRYVTMACNVVASLDIVKNSNWYVGITQEKDSVINYRGEV